MNKRIRKLDGANMDIDLATPGAALLTPTATVAPTPFPQCTPPWPGHSSCETWQPAV